MSKEIGFGIIGCGSVSRLHAKAISEIPGAKLVALCNRTREKAEKLAQEFQVDAIYTDYGELIDSEDLDVLNILTPSGTHGEIACYAAKKGKNVIVEKPMEIDLDRAKEMVDTFDKYNRKLSVIYQHRMDPDTIKLKKIIEEGRLGRIVLSDAHIKWYRTQSYYDSGKWRGTWALDGGGVLMNQGIHTIDLMIHIMGEVESVFAYCDTLGHKNVEVEDMATAVLRFKSGAYGTVVGSTCTYPGLPARLEIHGIKGSARLEGDKLIYLNTSDETIELENDIIKNTGTSNPMAIDYMSHKVQIEDMVNSIKENKRPLIDGVEGLKALKLILAIYESAKKGVEVKL